MKTLFMTKIRRALVLTAALLILIGLGSFCENSLNSLVVTANAAESSTTDTVGMGTVTASSLNIRYGAGTNYEIVGNFSKGHRIEILQVAGSWGRTVKGWVSLNYVKMDNATSSPSTETKTTYTTGMGTVTASSLNIRYGAGTNYEIVGNFSKGHRIEILQVAGSWGRTVKGWVSLNYVKMDNTTSSPSTETNTTYTTGMGTVTASSLNIRYGAGTNYEIVGNFSKGHRIEILQVAGSWGRTVKGWVSLKYVDMDVVQDFEEPHYTTGMGTVAVGVLNIRYGAGTNYEIAGHFSKGHRIEILQVSGSWGRTVSGWVNMQYIKMDK